MFVSEHVSFSGKIGQRQNRCLIGRYIYLVINKNFEFSFLKRDGPTSKRDVQINVRSISFYYPQPGFTCLISQTPTFAFFQTTRNPQSFYKRRSRDVLMILVQARGKRRGFSPGAAAHPSFSAATHTFFSFFKTPAQLENPGY